MTDQERNEAVARKLGWTQIALCDNPDFRNFKKVCGNNPKAGWEPIPDYCHSIEAAWEIVNWLYKSGEKVIWHSFFDLEYIGNGWLCRMRMAEWYRADTAPMAIVEAFLKMP